MFVFWSVIKLTSIYTDYTSEGEREILEVGERFSALWWLQMYPPQGSSGLWAQPWEMGGAWEIILEALCLRDVLPYSCLLLRAVICCWSIPAANYRNPCASSTCIWELEEAGDWGTEGSGLCLTICLVKYWYYLVSFPPTLLRTMQGEPRRLWSFIALTLLSVKHNSICPFLLTLAVHSHTSISKNTMARPCYAETLFALDRPCTAEF